jgi:hypothetical protein
MGGPKQKGVVQYSTCILLISDKGEGRRGAIGTRGKRGR